MGAKTKETLIAAAFGAAGGYLIHDVAHKPKPGQMTGMKIGSALAGALIGFWLVQGHSSPRYGG